MSQENEKDYYTYQETMDLIEDFMEKSGIKAFCMEICQGDCCDECNQSAHSCFQTEKRLACSVYICGYFKKAIFPSEKIRQLYSELDFEIVRELRKHKPSGYCNYYSVCLPEVRESFRISKKFVKRCLPSKRAVENIRERAEAIKGLCFKILKNKRSHEILVEG